MRLYPLMAVLAFISPSSADDAVNKHVQENYIDPVLDQIGNAARKGAGVRSQQPLPAVRVSGGSTFSHLPDWASALIRDELNVKRVDYAQELTEAVRQRAEANPKILGPKYGKDYPRLRGALQEGRFTVIDGRVKVEDWLLEPDEVTLSLEPAPGFAASLTCALLAIAGPDARTSMQPRLPHLHCGPR